MSNMHYCRFQNTLSALRDCKEDFETSDLSDEEKKAREKMLELMRKIISEVDM